MSVPVAPSVLATMERLVLSRLTSVNWGDAVGRRALYTAIEGKLATANTSEESREQHLMALEVVSQNVEAAAIAATDHSDFLELVAAARDVPAPEEPQPEVSPVAAVAAVAGDMPAVQAPKIPPTLAGDGAPRTEEKTIEPGPVREIPIWPFMALIAIAALIYAFWPASACSLRSTVCLSDRVVSAGPGLTDVDARKLRFAILGVQSTPTHVFARLRINNTSDKTVHAISANPLRMAFRLRPSSQPVDAQMLQQFDPNRIELKEDIPPGATIEVLLLAAKPPGSAALMLDVSFVVEGRFWAFLIGAPPVTVAIP